jgi:hypothetical protein
MFFASTRTPYYRLQYIYIRIYGYRVLEYIYTWIESAGKQPHFSFLRLHAFVFWSSVNDLFGLIKYCIYYIRSTVVFNGNFQD